MYVVGLSDWGPYRGEWVVVRKFDGAIWSEGFSTKYEAEIYASYLNGLHQ